MGNSLAGKSVLVIGRPSGIARAITEAAVAEGAEVTVAGRDAAKLRQAYDENENVHGVAQPSHNRHFASD
jgi:NAD(P)-dependent dehydrogenase (short-subunit alcohol dehydrogenase family)